MFDLARWSPAAASSNPFQLHREIDELFTRFFGQHPGRSGSANDGSAPMWSPAVESWTSEGHLHIRVALPGVDPKDVDLSVTDNVLTLKGQRKVQNEVKQATHLLREFSYGEFERSLVLPEGMDAAKVTAKYTNGMLEITMPLPQPLAPKRVDIQIEGSGGTQKAIRAS